jgi:polyphosphate:AMP phosphotransferase
MSQHNADDRPDKTHDKKHAVSIHSSTQALPSVLNSQPSTIQPRLPQLIHAQPDELNLALLEAQLQLRAQNRHTPVNSVLILVSGIELAGKGEAVTQLREWVDPRYLKVKANLSHSLADNQPFWQDYTDAIPACGQIVVLFGNWYGDLLHRALHDADYSSAQLQQALAQMRQFEQDLQANGVTLIKCWFDISWACLQQRLDQLDPSARQWQQLHGLDWRDPQQYQRIQQIRQQMTDDWFVINGEDAEWRNLAFGHLVLDALKTPQPVLQAVSAAQAIEHQAWQAAEIPALLLYPASQKLEKQHYKLQLAHLQQALAPRLRQQAQQSAVVLVFEGMDAAGKGGAIRRVVAALDPREYEIHSIAAPDSFELRHPYLWRFWQRLPKPGGITIFDRSWYGRVLVERVEGLASEAEWQRAYAEIIHFEQQLSQCGIVVVKFWLGVSKSEQLKRFKSREETAHKRYKLTDEDWRNRKKWDRYLQAAADMLQHTHSPQSPWHIIATDDKRTARLQVLEAINNQLAVTSALPVTTVE